MRCTQIIGLTKEAEDFLEKSVKKIPDPVCPECGNVLGFKYSRRPYFDARDEGMFGDGPMLFEYDLNDGRVAKEVIQAVPWSSGPCIFMCLEVDGERMFEWSQEEIDQA